MSTEIPCSITYVRKNDNITKCRGRVPSRPVIFLGQRWNSAPTYSF